MEVPLQVPFLATADEVMKAAGELEAPAVAFETSRGSARARFLLLEIGPNRVVGELSRQLFNSMRVNGMVDDDLENRYRVDERTQAFPLMKEA